ncbi:MAG: hypothetical protein H7A35_10310 [Planctomycetales bacterium]|nr:hypothetical protein [bacterium]UNM07263.1 MAG: hypothetical protein H7A35_10310 [Planctomycetales bacterium]
MTKNSRLLSALIILLIAGVIGSCVNRVPVLSTQEQPATEQLDETQFPDNADQEPLSPVDKLELPGIPAGQTEQSSSKRSSASTITLDGKARVNAAGSNNRVSGSSYVLAADAEQQTAWAWYTLGGLSIDRPVNLNVNVAPAAILPGGEEQPVSYYVGVSNYSTYRWQWFGPFDASTEIVLNSDANRERYVSGIDVPQMHAVILSSSEAGTALQIDSLEVELKQGFKSTGYQTTRPIKMQAQASNTLGDKSASSLSKEHYITLTWNFIPDPLAPENEATTVRVNRRLVGDSVWQPIGDAKLGPISEQYIDFADNAQPFEGTAGRTYEYFLGFFNIGGYNSSGIISEQIPLLQPHNLIATPSGNPHQITLTWEKSSDATSYEIFRDTIGQPYAVVGDVDSYVDEQCGNIPHEYWVKSKNEWSESALDISAIGIAVNLSNYNLSTNNSLWPLSYRVHPDGSFAILVQSDNYSIYKSTTTIPISAEDWIEIPIIPNSQGENRIEPFNFQIDDNGIYHICAVKTYTMVQEPPLPNLNKFELYYGRSINDNPLSVEDWEFTAVDISDEFEESSLKNQLYPSITFCCGVPQIMYYEITPSYEAVDVVRYAISNVYYPQNEEDWSLFDLTEEFTRVRLPFNMEDLLVTALDKPAAVVTGLDANGDWRFSYLRGANQNPQDQTEWEIVKGPVMKEINNTFSIANINGNAVCSSGQVSLLNENPTALMEIAIGFDQINSSSWFHEVIYPAPTQSPYEFSQWLSKWTELDNYQITSLITRTNELTPTFRNRLIIGKDVTTSESRWCQSNELHTSAVNAAFCKSMTLINSDAILIVTYEFNDPIQTLVSVIDLT